MKKKNLFLSVGLAFCTGLLMAQSVPTHPNYIDYGTDNNQRFTEEFVKMLDQWEPGDKYLSKSDANYNDYWDDSFFISRVPMKSRFTNTATQANPDLVPGAEAVNEKKLCWFSPIGEMSKQWSGMSRYAFESDNFGMWQYLDVHSNVSSQLFRSPGVFNDVAHKNGVVTGAYYFIDWASAVSPTSAAGKPLAALCAKNGSTFKYAKKLAQLMKYYGINGLAFNPEGTWSGGLQNDFPAFLAQLHKEGEAIDWPIHVAWYAFVTNTGGLSDDGCALTTNSQNWFHNTSIGAPVTDVYFLNYNWTASDLSTSVATAKGLGRNPFDVYAGFDQQGRGYGQYGAAGNNGGWNALASNPVSIVVWGAHDRSQLYANSSARGTAEKTIQETYQDFQEMLFTGGTKNVLSAKNLPLKDYCTVTASDEDLADWHGYSRFINAKSTLQELPFVTRFNLGNGLSFKKEGKVTFDQKWYNLGMQDYLPTWRWWIDLGNRTVPSDPIQCDFDFDEAWYGGSSLKLSGKTAKSEVNLFKTKFRIESTSDKFSLTYKVKNATAPNLKFKVSLEGSESTYKYYTIPTTGFTTDSWTTVEFTAANLGLKANDVIATMGVVVENTSENYALYLGEMSLIPASYNKTPRAPRILHVTPEKRVYNAVDFKMVWSMLDDGVKDLKADGTPYYNEDVDAWYYEIYIRTSEDEEPILLTATTSWAGYVIDAPLSTENATYYQVGVRAVGLDGSESEITWSGNQTSELQKITTLLVSKPVIKPNEEFDIYFEDPNYHPSKIRVLSALTGTEIKTADNTSRLTLSLPEIGCYDVEVTADGATTMTRGCILISPEETGRMPIINSYTASPSTAEVGQEITLTPSYTPGTKYGSNKQATASQAIYITDPNVFYVPYQVLTSNTDNTFCFWFKSDEFEHGSLGTSIAVKRNENYTKDFGSSMGWVVDEWQEMWCCLRPQNYGTNPNGVGTYANDGDEISINFDGVAAGGSAGNGQMYEHNANVDGLSYGYKVSPNVWNHIAIVKQSGGRNASYGGNANGCVLVYLNGREVINCSARGGGPRAWNANFYIGIAVQNTSTFKGWIDEVQLWDKALSASEVVEAMNGYDFDIPSELKGYFKFEEIEVDADGNPGFWNEGNSNSVQYAYVGSFTENAVTGRKEEKPGNPTVGPGVPMMVGTSEIALESVEWILEGAKHTTNDSGVATATYSVKGEYPVTLAVTNSWGTTTKTFDNLIQITGTTDLDNNVVENFYVYPNPFVKDVNLRFANSGLYNIAVYDVQGRMITEQQYEARNGAICTLSVNNGKGMYYVVVSQNGKTVQSFKVIAQ